MDSEISATLERLGTFQSRQVPDIPSKSVTAWIMKRTAQPKMQTVATNSNVKNLTRVLENPEIQLSRSEFRDLAALLPLIRSISIPFEIYESVGAVRTAEMTELWMEGRQT